MSLPRTTLEHWHVLQAIVEHGSFAKAAEALHRSQSSVSYMVARLQEQLDVPLLAIEGRKAQLTEAGRVLLAQARRLLDDARALEQHARNLKAGWEAEIRLVVDGLFPRPLLTRVLHEVDAGCPQSRVQLSETVLSGAEDALLRHEADVVICNSVPQGFLGDPLMDIEFIAVAHPEHALHRLAREQSRELTLDDLARELHIVVRDSGTQGRDDGWLGSTRRWTVTSGSTRLALMRAGLGFGWAPLAHIEDDLAAGRLKPLPLREGRCRKRTLYLVLAEPRDAGPGARRVAEIIRACVAGYVSPTAA
jgi:DNA-binding transcriptional LysR family regulator